MNGMFSMCSELTFCVNQRVNRLIIYVVSTFFSFHFLFIQNSLWKVQRKACVPLNVYWNALRMPFEIKRNASLPCLWIQTKFWAKSNTDWFYTTVYSKVSIGKHKRILHLFSFFYHHRIHPDVVSHSKIFHKNPIL